MARCKVLELVIRQPCDLNDARCKFATRSFYLGYTLRGEITAAWQENLFGPADAIVRAPAKKVKYFSDEPSEDSNERTEPVSGER